MFDTIIYKTKRLVLRPLTLTDYDLFLNSYNHCKEAKNRFDDGRFDTSFMTVDWFKKMLERRKSEAQNDYSYMFAIINKVTMSILVSLI